MRKALGYEPEENERFEGQCKGHSQEQIRVRVRVRVGVRVRVRVRD